MHSRIGNLNVIDIISERHAMLRKIAEERWQEASDLDFSHTELFLISKAGQESLTVSQAAAIMKISRQAMQKCAAGLEARGYLGFERQAGNRREKFMVLTEAGAACSRRYEGVKEGIEREIGEKIGKDALAKLKAILSAELL